MIGFLYLGLALGCWTVWAVLSARLGGQFSPLNNLLWTGLVSAVITLGGFVVHYPQLRLPNRGEWVLLTIFCAANTVACFGYYAALKHLPGTLVLPLSHLYLVIGPVLLALFDRRGLSWQQFGALCLVMGGLILFLAVSPETNSRPAVVDTEEELKVLNGLKEAKGLSGGKAGASFVVGRSVGGLPGALGSGTVAANVPRLQLPS